MGMLNLMTSTQTLFPNKFTCVRSGGQTWTCIWGDHHSTHYRQESCCCLPLSPAPNQRRGGASDTGTIRLREGMVPSGPLITVGKVCLRWQRHPLPVAIPPGTPGLAMLLPGDSVLRSLSAAVGRQTEG